MKKVWEFVKKWYALMVVVSAFLWAGAAIFTRRVQEAPPGTAVIRIGHWQLEPGVRTAFEIMGAKYAKMRLEKDGVKVRVAQDAIPESTYGQWMSTQLMGGTSPDIMECGLGLSYNVLVGYYNRYFAPLTQYVGVPNPYNAGNAFSNTPWRVTFKDGMRGSYIEEVQEYMLVPLSQFGQRIFYNMDLLEKLTGLTTPPKTWGEFKKVCETIQSQKLENGQYYTPIASSKYHFGGWDGFMGDPLTYSIMRKADFSRDGAVDNGELFTAVTAGSVHFLARPYRARFGLIRELTKFFQAGFTGLGRDEAVFLFAQQRAVFLSTGTWDQGALREQAKGLFTVGIMDYPQPTPDDPDYGDVVEGPRYERPAGGFPFAITRTSPNFEVALDFMLWLSSKEINEEFNRLIGWIPSILDTELVDELKNFEPNLKGVYGASPFTLGGDTIIKWQQEYALFQVGQTELEPMMERFTETYLRRGKEEYDELVRNARRGLASDERVVAGLRVQMIDAPTPEAAELASARYRRVVLNRIVGRELNHGMLRRIQAGKSPFAGGDPYSMSPEAEATVRKRITAELDAE